MSEFKGTKRKWLLNDTKNPIFGGKNNYHQISSGEGFYDDSNPNGFSITGFILKEDALLITKAPEMLEMLEKIYQQVDFSFDAWGSDTGIKMKYAIKKLIKEATEL